MKKLLLLSLLLPAFASAQTYQWSFDLGDAQDDYGNDVVVDANGNSYVTGYYNGTVDFNPGSGTDARTAMGGHDVFVASYNAAGNFRWVSTMGGPQDDHGIKLCLDNLGHVNITGNIAGSADADPGSGVFTLSASNSGNGVFVWQLNAATGVLVRAMLIDASAQGNAIAVDGSGNILITGVFNMNADFNPGIGTLIVNTVGANDDVFIAKYDNNFNFAWAKALGGTGGDQGLCIDADANGNAYIGGYITGNIDLDAGSGTTMSGASGNYEGFVVSYNSSGQFVWGFGLTSPGNDMVRGLTLNNTALYICGHFGGTLDLDPTTAVASIWGNGPQNGFAARYTTTGSYFGLITLINSFLDESIADITMNTTGAIYVTGYMAYNNVGIDFDPYIGTQIVHGFGGYDIFIARYVGLVGFVWAFAAGGSTGNDGGSAVAVLGSELWATGYFNGNADFDPAGAVVQLSAGTGADAYVAKYGTVNVGISENETGLSSTLFPNPATDLATLQLNLESPGDVTISLFTISGQLIRTEKHTQQPAGTSALPVDFSALAPGIYLLRIETAGGTQHLRICRP